MTNEIFKEIMNVNSEESNYYCLVLGNKSNIDELSKIVCNYLKCDEFDENLLNVKEITKSLENAYHKLDDRKCAEIYYNGRCITGYFIGNLDFYKLSSFEMLEHGGALGLKSIFLPRDCDDLEFNEAAKEIYPDKDFDVVYNSCICSPFSEQEVEIDDDVDPDLMLKKWLEIKEKKINESDFIIFCAHAV